MWICKWALLTTVVCLSASAQAYRKGSASIGIGYFSQNILSQTSQNPDGSSGSLGEVSYPLYFKYDFSVGTNWFLAPALSFTPLPRSSPGDSSKISMTHLVFELGKNMSGNWDWYIGPGLMNYEIKGAGGTTIMSNGTGSSTFALPGRSVWIRKVTTNVGFGYNSRNARLGLNLIFESIGSSTKRTQNLMVSLAYHFGGH